MCIFNLKEEKKLENGVNGGSVQFYCSNCGRKISAHRSEDGALRIVCPRCKTAVFSKIKSKKVIFEYAKN